MKFSFTDEQDMFRDTVRELFADLCPPEAVRASWENDDGRVPGLWSALAEMGVLGASVPESQSGLGFDEVDVVLIACPATEGTQGLIGPEHLAVMKKTAILVNLARGGIVDEPALIACLN